MKLAKLVAAELKDHFFEPRLAAFKECGVEREPTDAERLRYGHDLIWEVKPEHIPEHLARIKDLQAVPVTVPWGPVTAVMFDTCPEVTGADLLALGPLFELDEPESDVTK